MAGGPAAPTGTARHATDRRGLHAGNFTERRGRRGPAGRASGRPGPPSRSRKLRTSATPRPQPGPGPGVHSTGPAPLPVSNRTHGLTGFRSRWTQASLIGP